MLKLFWISESAEDYVEKRKIGVVHFVDTPCMMVGVTLRTLNNISQPLWRLDIGMLKDAEKVRYKKHYSDGLRTNSGNQTETNATQYGPTNHVQWAKEKGAIGIKPFSAVMQLVESLPKKIASMHKVMPRKDTELIEQDSYQCTPPCSKRRQIKQSVGLQIRINEHREIR